MADLTIIDVRELRKVSSSTVRRWCKSGLSHYKIGNIIRIKSDDLKDFLSHFRRDYAFSEKLLKNALTIVPPIGIDRDEGGQTVARVSKTRHNYGYGSIYQRKPGGRWTIDYRDAKGKRIQQVVKGATSNQEAHEALRQAVFEAHFGKRNNTFEKERITFAVLADMYIEDWAKTNKASWRTDQSRVKEMKKFFKGRDCSSITSQDVEQYKMLKRGQGVQLTTVNKHVQILSKLFNCGISWGYLKENPCKGVKKYPEERFRRKRVLSREEEARLLKAIGPAYIKSMVKIILNSGLRRKELFQLTWEQVDFKKRQLFIKETKTARGRYVPMNKTNYNMLLEIHQSRSDDGLVFRNPKTGNAYVCIRKTFNRACKKGKKIGRASCRERV